MAYVSLYRKYRPQSFTEVVGQDHVTRTVVNALDEDRLHHAYLFTGPRGTGKTSTARILAKSVNCEQGPTSSPCNACEQCRAITEGSSVDVIELDMASHGGVDDARELRDRALFAPASGRKKVYILDEVHMASTAAFNALLKLIEEPPDHVVFTMATTDPQKVIPTIMSRVQRLDLRRVPAGALADHVRDIVAREAREIDDPAVEAVVRAGDGSVRDTLSVLEQVLSFSGGTVTGDEVAQVLGHTPFERTAAAVDAAAAADLAGALGLVQQLIEDGHDLRRFAFDLLQHLRDLVVLQVAPDRPDLVDATEDRRAQLAEQAGRVDRGLLVRAVDLLAGAVTEMRQGPPRLPLELAFAKLTTSSTTATPASAPTPQPAPAAPEPASAAAEPEPEPVSAPEPEPAVQDEREPAESEPTEPKAAEPDPADPDPAEPEPAETAAEPDSEPVHDLAARANARAERTAAEGGPPPPPEDRPAGPEAEYTAPPPPDDSSDLDTIRSRWAAVLELVDATAKRFGAIYEASAPVKLRHGILTLAFRTRHKSFHAEQAMAGDHQQALADAVQQACGVRIRVDVVIDDDAVAAFDGQAAGGSAPAPPAEPTTGRTESAPPSPQDEELAVREAESTARPVQSEETVEAASQLLTNELGAVEVAEDEV